MNAVKRIFTVLLSVAALSALSAQAGQKQIVRTGIEVLEGRGFEGLVGKNVGLVTNPSGIDHNLRSTIDILHEAPGVNLKALFAPEHGVRGDAYAGSHVEDFKDPKTGIPVYSIYGSNRKPSKKMLEGLDIVVYDIQDIGSRSYTFISTLGLVMRACAENGIEVMVLTGLTRWAATRSKAVSWSRASIRSSASSRSLTSTASLSASSPFS